MNKEAFIEEMLQEVKNLKDLAKDELPIVVKEYIRYNIISSVIGLILSGALLTLAAICDVIAWHSPNECVQCLCSIAAALSGTVGTILGLCSGDTFLACKLQPRRMAIKAITSLTKGND